MCRRHRETTVSHHLVENLTLWSLRPQGADLLDQEKRKRKESLLSVKESEIIQVNKTAPKGTFSVPQISWDSDEIQEN